MSGGALIPLPAAAAGEVRELSGEVRLNGYPMSRESRIFPEQTVTTGADGSVWFTLDGDAFFLRPRSELRLRASRAGSALVDALRLITGAIGATFEPGRPRSVAAGSATIGIRGTGVYIEASPLETYACTCFGATDVLSTATGSMMESVRVAAQNHQARRIYRDPQMGMRVVAAPFERHTSEEIARLEALAGRANPFRS